MDFWISVWISADSVRDFFRDGSLEIAIFGFVCETVQTVRFSVLCVRLCRGNYRAIKQQYDMNTHTVELHYH